MYIHVDTHRLKGTSMIQDWFLEECIHSNHLVFKIHMIKLTCENFIKFGVQVFEKTANNGFYFISYFVHVYMALDFDCCNRNQIQVFRYSFLEDYSISDGNISQRDWYKYHLCKQ